jgi:hypothetical protein
MATKIMFMAVAALGLVIVLAGWRTQGVKDDSRVKDEFRFDAAKLKERALWNQVNDEPYYLTSNLNIQCAAPTAADYKRQRENNPHKSSFITVYVNNAGKEAMFTQQAPKFPEGSIIVKQKLDSKDRKPILYTIMRKRESGYNPPLGDWEFSVVGANGTELLAKGKLENCQSCHLGEGTSDFVFRDYVKVPDK